MTFDAASRGLLDALVKGVEDALAETMRIVVGRLDEVTEALLSGDVQAADEIIVGDDEIDLQMIDTEDQCLRTLATQQPVATDLRSVVASLYMTADVERSADLIVNIAKAIGRLQGVHIDERVRDLIYRMSAQGQVLFERAAQAVETQDRKLAASIDGLDDVLDELHQQFIEAVLASAAHHKITPQQAVQFAMIGRFYERIGDHAENIGERVQFAVSGWRPERAAADRARARRAGEEDERPVIRSRGMAVIDQQSEERRIDAIRRDFVANVSHELKTPVGALSLLTDALRDEDDEETRQRLLGLAGREVGRLEDIIDDLIELARLEDAEPVGAVEIEIDAVIIDAVEATESLARHRNIEIAVTGIPSRRQVVGDHRQLVRALSALIDNALRYSDENSQVTVGVVALPDTVEISVRDEGSGIERAELERIFERFYRVDRARSRETGGTGLGLSIVRHVAENHRGKVLVDSKLGEGTTFTVQLPLTPS